MTEEEILDLFRAHGALLEGHFVLSSGLHSDRYVQCALVLQYPALAEKLCAQLAERLRGLGAQRVAAPALGGIIVAHEVARALGLPALFTERQGEKMVLRRGFTLAPEEATVVVEDVITTGGSTRETMAAIEQAGGRVVGMGALVDRSGGATDFSLPKHSLLKIAISNFQPAKCPLCKSGTPAIKPGSHTKK